MTVGTGKTELSEISTRQRGRGLAPDSGVSVNEHLVEHRYREQAPSHRESIYNVSVRRFISAPGNRLEAVLR
ncbi:hypothetical protein GCM10009086_52770 [Pseudomonas rhodesiae]